jgi:RNA methyltransferase, TrmH family
MLGQMQIEAASMNIQSITSRDNAQVKAIKKLANSNAGYKEAGQIWLEGEHLCDAFLLSSAQSTQKHSLTTAVLSQSAANSWLTRLASIDCQVIVLPDSLLANISSLPSSAGLGFVLAISNATTNISKTAHTVILDGVQDAGNVGSILRSAAALGVQQVLALQGTAALWSPKVLRAGMGAHFELNLVEGLLASDIDLAVPILATHVHGGSDLSELQTAQKIPHPCAWVMGHEGQGVSEAMLDKASQRVRIKQYGQESLNVAAAAAVCLYASMPQDLALPATE